MTNHSHCLICSSKKLKPLEAYQKDFLHQCLDCGFVFSSQIPTEEELSKHYEGYGRNDYLSPVTIKRYHELLDDFEPYRKNNKILDVGCGIGYFLEVAKARGWNVYGTEYTDKAIEICNSKGIKMTKGKLNSKDFQAEEFDIITSFEVLEHINNPIEELTHFNQILRKGGLVYLTTPNFNSLLRYRLKENYDVICYPEHLSYYTPKTLKFLFNKSGFNTKKLLSTGISLTRLKNGNNKKIGKHDFVAPISEKSTDEKIRLKTEKNLLFALLKKITNQLLSFTGKGDSLKIYAIKTKSID